MDDKFKKLLAKVKSLQASGNYDLSLEEDLSIAIMNLISLEEHFFLTSQKTGKSDYLDLLQQTREVRKQLLAQMIPQHEGETWCITKHLLAATMRLIEVGTKYQADGKKAEADTSFTQAYKIYSLFWAVRLKLLDLKGVKKIDKALTIEDLTTQLIDCCQE
ncbi:MAG: hypothetical protein UW73_C0019G0020 [Microgenomates group bacterium GW2011_GWB1_44_8]|nr:MAG: hypothetical protein UW73_C0019G0020 [Microgenomates group bacterium GW2011_GWB1_44_8]